VNVANKHAACALDVDERARGVKQHLEHARTGVCQLAAGRVSRKLSAVADLNNYRHINPP
jgi:hypothetical protein